MSTNIFTKTKNAAKNKTEPITMGWSSRCKASNNSKPNPLQPKINSTKTAPANIPANHPDAAVITGFKAGGIAWRQIIRALLNPFDLAVLM